MSGILAKIKGFWSIVTFVFNWKKRHEDAVELKKRELKLQEQKLLEQQGVRFCPNCDSRMAVFEYNIERLSYYCKKCDFYATFPK